MMSQQQAGPQVVTININVISIVQGTANFSYANFTYVPGVLRVNRGDAVQWVCSDGPIAIQFKEGTPCDRVDARSGDASPSAPLVLNVSASAASGHYHYAVAAVVGGKVYLDAACPELIVN
jgi:hypothetical protein